MISTVFNGCAIMTATTCKKMKATNSKNLDAILSIVECNFHKTLDAKSMLSPLSFSLGTDNSNDYTSYSVDIKTTKRTRK